MPLFEYRCINCNARFAQLIGMTADSAEPACPKCGGSDVAKLVSKFTRARGEDEALDELEDSFTDDPRKMSRLVRDIGRRMGDEGDEHIDEFVEEAERELFEGAGEAEDPP